jgi:hypothetical protein
MPCSYDLRMFSEMGVPHGTSKSSILIGFSINHPFWGYPIYGNHHFDVDVFFAGQARASS